MRTAWVCLLVVACGGSNAQGDDDDDDGSATEPAWSIEGSQGSCYYLGDSVDDAGLCMPWDAADAAEAAASCEADSLVLGVGVWLDGPCTFDEVPLRCTLDGEPVILFAGFDRTLTDDEITSTCETVALICSIYGADVVHDGFCS